MSVPTKHMEMMYAGLLVWDDLGILCSVPITSYAYGEGQSSTQFMHQSYLYSLSADIFV